MTNTTTEIGRGKKKIVSGRKTNQANRLRNTKNHISQVVIAMRMNMMNRGRLLARKETERKMETATLSGVDMRRRRVRSPTAGTHGTKKEMIMNKGGEGAMLMATIDDIEVKLIFLRTELN